MPSSLQQGRRHFLCVWVKSSRLVTNATQTGASILNCTRTDVWAGHAAHCENLENGFAAYVKANGYLPDDSQNTVLPTRSPFLPKTRIVVTIPMPYLKIKYINSINAAVATASTMRNFRLSSRSLTVVFCFVNFCFVDMTVCELCMRYWMFVKLFSSNRR